MEALLAAGIDINGVTKEGESCLHILVDMGSVLGANCLIKHHEENGGNLNFDLARGIDGKTCLDIAMANRGAKEHADKKKQFSELALMMKEKRRLKEGETPAGACIIS